MRQDVGDLLNKQYNNMFGWQIKPNHIHLLVYQVGGNVGVVWNTIAGTETHDVLVGKKFKTWDSVPVFTMKNELSSISNLMARNINWFLV
ncbi:MAG: hypothetical protein Q8P20_01805 [bacterium]|nr:hypothetical protein [bacterium]